MQSITTLLMFWWRKHLRGWHSACLRMLPEIDPHPLSAVLTGPNDKALVLALCRHREAEEALERARQELQQARTGAKQLEQALEAERAASAADREALRGDLERRGAEAAAAEKAEAEARLARELGAQRAELEELLAEKERALQVAAASSQLPSS